MSSQFVNRAENEAVNLAFQAQPELQEQLRPLAIESTVSKGEFIFRQGLAQKGIYLVYEGSARLFMTNENGVEISSRKVGPGSILGLPATLCSLPYVFTAEAMEDCRIGSIDSEKLNSFLKDRALLCMQIVEIMSRELAVINATHEHRKSCNNAQCSLLGVCQGCSV